MSLKMFLIRVSSIAAWLDARDKIKNNGWVEWW